VNEWLRARKRLDEAVESRVGGLQDNAVRCSLRSMSKTLAARLAATSWYSGSRPQVIGSEAARLDPGAADRSTYAEGGGQAEWMMERPEVDGYYSELANYDSFTFREMAVTNNLGGVYYPGELNRQQYYMTNCVLTQTLSNPADLVDGSTPNNSGTITWEASGTGGWTPTACEDAG
jgi:hypothetical protein